MKLLVFFVVPSLALAYEYQCLTNAKNFSEAIAHVRSNASSIDCSQNIQFSRIDTFKDLERFTDLRSLSLHDNKLTAIPSTWEGLPSSLKYLSLSINELTSIPSTWTGMPSSLVYLDLRADQLTSIPSTWTDLPSSLGYLYLDSNQLTSIPSNWTDLPSSLGYLDLSSNQLTSIPSNWTDLPDSLTHLDLSSNQLTSIPSNWTDLPDSLAHLDLSSNQLTSVPSTWEGLPITVELLDLRYNLISGIVPRRYFNESSLLPRPRHGFGCRDERCSACSQMHYGRKCDMLTECNLERGVCNIYSCSGFKGSGQCSYCHDPAYLPPYCNSKKSPEWLVFAILGGVVAALVAAKLVVDWSHKRKGDKIVTATPSDEVVVWATVLPTDEGSDTLVATNPRVEEAVAVREDATPRDDKDVVVLVDADPATNDGPQG